MITKVDHQFFIQRRRNLIFYITFIFIFENLMKIFLLTESRDTKSRHAHIRNKKERKYTVKTTNENKESLIRIKDKMKIILKEYT